MRDKFQAYRTPTEAEFNALWENCIFVFDTNVLLNFYRYSPATRLTLTELFQRFAEKTWLPHQVGLEYLQRRVRVIVEQCKAYTDAAKEIDDHFSSLKAKLTGIKGHPFSSGEVLQIYETATQKVKHDLKTEMNKIEAFLEKDPILELLFAVFDGRTGDPYPRDRLDDIVKDWKSRCEKKLPPGYKDESPGDLIIWNQILDEAKKRKKPVILVTDDSKEDWWHICAGRTQGPRPELREEFLLATGHSFYMYKPQIFMEFANDRLTFNVEQSAIDEVQSMDSSRSQEQEILKLIARLGSLEHAGQRTSELGAGAQSEPVFPMPTELPSGMAVANSPLSELPSVRDFQRWIELRESSRDHWLEFLSNEWLHRKSSPTVIEEVIRRMRIRKAEEQGMINELAARAAKLCTPVKPLNMYEMLNLQYAMPSRESVGTDVKSESDEARLDQGPGIGASVPDDRMTDGGDAVQVPPQ